MLTAPQVGLHLTQAGSNAAVIFPLSLRAALRTGSSPAQLLLHGPCLQRCPWGQPTAALDEEGAGTCPTTGPGTLCTCQAERCPFCFPGDSVRQNQQGSEGPWGSSTYKKARDIKRQGITPGKDAVKITKTIQKQKHDFFVRFCCPVIIPK